jgi:hypothetical protein
MGADRAKHAFEAFDDFLSRGFGAGLGATHQNGQGASGKAEAEGTALHGDFLCMRSGFAAEGRKVT